MFDERDLLYRINDIYEILDCYKKEIYNYSNVVFLGTGNDASICYKYLHDVIKRNFKIFFLDNDTNKHGMLIHNKYTCYGVDKLYNLPAKKTIVILATSLYAEEIYHEMNEKEIFGCDGAKLIVWRYFVCVVCRIEENMLKSFSYLGVKKKYSTVQRNHIKYMNIIKSFDEGNSSVMIINEKGVYCGLVAYKALSWIRDYQLVSKMYLSEEFCLKYEDDKEEITRKAKDIFSKTFIDEIPVVYEGVICYVISKYATWSEAYDYQRLKWELIDLDIAYSILDKKFSIICSSNSRNMVDFKTFFGDKVQFCNTDKLASEFDLYLFESIAFSKKRKMFRLVDLYCSLLFKTLYRKLMLNNVKVILVDTNDSRQHPFNKDRCLSKNEYEIFEQGGVWHTLPIGVNVKQHKDVSTKYLNVIGGRRYTPGSFDGTCRTIYFFGACTAFGSYADDSGTIEAYLQDSFNKRENLERIRVVNSAHGSNTPGINDLVNALYIIANTEFYCGDIIVLMKVGLSKNDVDDYISLAEIFNQSNNKEIVCFVDSYRHCNKKGNEIISNYLYKYICGVIKEIPFNGEKVEYFYERDNNTQLLFEEMDVYLTQLEALKTSDEHSNIGAIVMNCNPFTKGHSYLIEEARKQTDFLYVFVVQEDKSFFKFNDRLSMVKEYCSQYDDVKVLPSGKLMISNLTFSEYFNKEDLQDQEVIPTRDIRIFGSIIAPRLNIKKRFVGMEPFDNVTRQYNETMKKILPEYNCSVVEIPRLELNNEIVSATKVRKLLQVGKLTECRKYIPNTTWQLLENSIIHKH